MGWRAGGPWRAAPCGHPPVRARAEGEPAYAQGADAMNTRGRMVGVLLSAILPLTGCLTERGTPERSSSNETVASPHPTRTSETSRPTPEEEAAEAATAAFEEMLRVTDAASRNPGARDWEPEVREYSADPAAFLAVQSVRDLAALGLRQEGSSRVGVEVAAVDLEAPEGPTVKLTGCYDSQSTQIIDVKSGDVVPPGTPARFVWDITVLQYVEEPGQPWLVSTLEPRTDRPC